MLNLTLNFFDDGAATEPDAVMAAIEALTKGKNDFLWLWISGKDKGADLTELANLIVEKMEQNKIFRLSLCGEVGRNLNEKLKMKNEKLDFEVVVFKQTLVKQMSSLEQIKNEFGKWLEENSENFQLSTFNFQLNIVLSPCGSSFDEFENYTKRSEFWVDYVNNLS